VKIKSGAIRSNSEAEGVREDDDVESFGQLSPGYNLLMLNREIFSLERMTKVNL